MAYKNKYYVSYDADDTLYYTMLQAWCENDNISFVHHNPNNTAFPTDKSIASIKNSFKEKIQNTKCFFILLSEHCREYKPFMKMELDIASEFELPIVVININGKRSLDSDLCPAIIQDKISLHISFNAKIIQKAIEVWPEYYQNNKDKEPGARFFKTEVYQNLGL